MKVLLSVGGWNFSDNFTAAVLTPENRITFAYFALTLVTNLGLDGLDIDWEYPSNEFQSINFTLLLQETRGVFDTYTESLDTPFHLLLTVACPVGPTNYKLLYLNQMDQYIDFWNLMAYDYAGLVRICDFKICV